MRTRRLLAHTGLALVFAWAACQPSIPNQGPTRVVIVGMDTTRRDHMGVHGGPTALTPGLDKIAAQSVVFDTAWAPAPRTRPSFRSAFTGRWPIPAKSAPKLASLLGARGFSTAGFVANVQLSSALGFAEGFDTWTLDNMAAADTQVDATIAWLKNHEGEDALVFVHLMDPHIFYTAPKPYLDRFTAQEDRQGLPDRYNAKRIAEQQRHGLLSNGQKRWIHGRYMGEIAFMDAQISRLVTKIDAMDQADNGRTWMVFHSDHGEEFWDHGGFEHNHSLHDELLKAVLWFRPPGGRVAGEKQVGATVSLVDIVPTILGILDKKNDGLPPFDGQDLSPFIVGDPETSDLTQSLNSRPLQIGHMMHNREQWGVVLGDDKYILTTATGETEWTRGAAPQTGRNTALEGALSQAVGAPIVQGWRLKFSKLTAPLKLYASTDIHFAEIIDPQSITRRPANIEWGETVDKTRADVATIALIGRTVTIHPGPNPSGVLFIAANTTDAQLSTDCGDSRVAAMVGAEITLCGHPFSLSLGPYLRPSPQPEYRLANTPKAESIHALQQLGYLD